MADFPQTTEELEQLISDYMDAHIAERVTVVSDEALQRNIKSYMERYGAAIEDSGEGGSVPLVADNYFTTNNGEHLADTTLPMARVRDGLPDTFIQSRIRALALAAASMVEPGDMATPIVEQTDNDVAISPNVLNVWNGSLAQLTIDFEAGIEGRVSEYMLRFTAGVGFILTMPNGVRWTDGTPDFEAGNTYEVSIVDNNAIYAAWE